MNQRRETGENQNRKLSMSFTIKNRRMREANQGRNEARRGFLFSFLKEGESSMFSGLMTVEKEKWMQEKREPLK